MGLRLNSTGYTRNGNRYDVLIYDSNYSGSVVDFGLDGEGYLLHYETGSEELLPTIVSTRCEFVLIMKTAAHEAFINDLNTAYEDQFTVVIKYGNLTKWFGRILPDLVTLEDRHLDQYPNFRIRATDGIKKLQTKKYKNTSAPYFGQNRLVDHLLKCISFIGLSQYKAEAWLLETAVNWYATEQTTGDPAANIYFDHRALYQVDEKKEITYTSVYDVLKMLCERFHAKFLLQDGMYKFVQHNEAIATSVGIYRYLENGSLFNNGTVNIDHPVNNSFRGKLSGGRFTFHAAVSEVEVNYIHFGFSNIAQGVIWNDGSQPVLPENSSTYQAGANSVVSFQSDLNYQILTTGPKPYYIIFDILIKVGDNYLGRSIFVNGGTISYGDEVISTDSANRFQYPVAFDHSIIEPGVTLIDERQLDVAFSTIKFATAGEVTFSIESATLKDRQNGTITTGVSFFSWDFGNNKLNIVKEGKASNYSNTKTVRVENQAIGNSIKKTLNVPIGEALGYGRLMVHNGTTRVEGTGWGVGAGVPGVTIEELLAREFLKTRVEAVKVSSTVIERYHSTYNTAYGFNETIVHKGNKWVPRRGTYHVHKEHYNAEWYLGEVGVSTGTKTEEDTVLKDIPGGATVFTPYPIAEGGNPGAGKEKFPDKAPGLVSVIFPAAEGDILKDSTVTSIEVPTRTKDGEYKTGQEIILINPWNLLQQTFEVSQDSTVGDTVINVISQTANGYFPEGSLIVTTQEQQAQIIDKRKVFRNVDLGTATGQVTKTHDLNTEDIQVYLEDEGDGTSGVCPISNKTPNTVTFDPSGTTHTYKIIITA